MILRTNNNFGQEIRKHFFSNAETHLDISEAHITSYHMVTNLKVPNVAKLGWIGSNVEARLGVCIQFVRLRGREAEKP
jgi:hypothetical protein